MSAIPGSQGFIPGSPGVDGTAPPGTPVKQLFYMALRLAGVTKGPQITPSPDQLLDCLQQGNLLLGRANTNSLLILGQTIQAFPLTSAKIYTIGGPGLGADFDVARPQRIELANLIFTRSGQNTRLPMSIYDYRQWGSIRLQDIPNGLPRRLYFDGNSPIGKIYIWTQDPGGDQLELYTWNTLTKLVSAEDTVSWPDGYEDWFVNNLAVRLASVFHAQGAAVTDDTRAEALRSAADVESMNADTPQMDCNPGVMPIRSSRGGWNRYTGEFE